MGSTIRSLGDKRRTSERQIEKFRSRDNALQNTFEDLQKAVQTGQGKLQNNSQKIVEIEMEMPDFHDEITRLESTDRTRANDAGSVQQSNTNTSCCGGDAANISTVFEDW